MGVLAAASIMIDVLVHVSHVKYLWLLDLGFFVFLFYLG